MSKIRVLSAANVEKLFTVDMAVEAVEKAYAAKNDGTGGVWPMVFHEFETGVADLDIKSGDLGDIFGLKLVSWYAPNAKRGLPELFGTILLCDRATGEPLAVMNAGPVTGLRTGAAAAVGAKYLARPDSKALTMVGCGAQSPYLIAAALYVMPQLDSVTLVNPHSPARAAERLDAVSSKVASLLERAGAACRAEIRASEDVESAVRSSDIVFTATPSREPMIRAEWVRPGTHFSCIGADISGKQEIDSEILHRARVFGDDETQCFAVGECEIPHRDGLLDKLCAEIGEVVLGRAQGRLSSEDVTVFDSTGIALQDLSSGAVILSHAEKAGAGSVVEL